MAEFQEVHRQFDRMCRYYQRKRECPMGCPMNGANISQCRKVAFEEPIVTEKTVMSWAAEHPEPVYPTWREYLESIGVIVPRKNYTVMDAYALIIGQINTTRISADIAEKLGIEPKEV